MTKRRQAEIDPRPTSRAEGIFKCLGIMDAQDRPGPSEVATCGHFVFGNWRWTVL